jgi:plastocyanin
MMGESTSDRTESVSRRGFIRATGAAAGATVATGGGVGAVEEASAQAETYEFGGEVQAWRGRAPSSIEGEDNPTLELEAGQEYEVVWENVDGQPHDFTIQNSEGTTLEQSEQTSEEGATASLTFTATAEMTQYVCTIHPTTMVGDIQVSGGQAGGGEAGGNGDGPPLWALLMVSGVVLAFVSPLLFALLLFSRGRDGAEREPVRR